jgi:hypothetical protein
VRTIHPALIPLMRRADPTAREYLEAVVTMRHADGTQSAHIRQRKEQWFEADWAVGATLTSSGLTSFDSTKVANGNFADVAWNTDTSVPGAYIRADFGAGNTRSFCSCTIWALGDNNLGQYAIEYSDDASAWTTVASIAPRNGPGDQVPGVGPVSEQWHFTVANGLADASGNLIPHRYWRIRLTNTPGVGPSLSELHFGEFMVFDDGTERFVA